MSDDPPTPVRLHEYVILSHNSDPPREHGRLWWDGEQVQSDPPCLKETVIYECSMVSMEVEVNGERKLVVLRPEHGVPFLESLPMRFGNGYMSCRRVKP